MIFPVGQMSSICAISQGAGLPKYKFRSTQTTEKV